MGKNDFDMAIIGGGLAGAATAYHLAKNSTASILLLEKEKTFASHASGKNAAMLRQAVPMPAIASAVQETLRALLNPPEDWKEPNGFRMTGSLLLGSREGVERLHRVLVAAGGTAEVFDRNEFPETLSTEWREQLRQADYSALLYAPEDGVVDVPALVKNFLCAAQERGVRALAGREVSALCRSADVWTLDCASESFTARTVVDASGAWAGRLIPGEIGNAPELQSFRRHLMDSEPLPRIEAASPWIWHVEKEFYFRPEGGGLLLSPGDEDPWPVEEAPVDPAAAEWLARKLRLHFPALGPLNLKRTWACLRTKTRDGNFLIRWDENVPDYFWVAALGGHGVSASYGVGRAAAQEIIKKI